MSDNKINQKIFIHYLDRDKKGKDIDVQGYFELVKEEPNFVIIKTEKNTIKIPYHRLIKLKGGNNKI